MVNYITNQENADHFFLKAETSKPRNTNRTTIPSLYIHAHH